ncbi:MAG: ROK family protein, partial [Lentisphaerae bacterium]|nr:ROK family protein [Lentisphaerota bacterium]
MDGERNIRASRRIQASLTQRRRVAGGTVVKDLERTDRRRMRALNTQLVLDCIRKAELTSQADLIRATKLNTGTIVSIVRDLRERGLVVGAGQGPSRGGRRPALLRLNPSAAAVLSCQVGTEVATAAVLDLGATILSRREWAVEAARGPEPFLAALVACLRDQLQAPALKGRRLAGLGLSLHGAVDAERGVLRVSEHLGWYDVPFRDELQRALGIPVFAEGEARAIALAEQRWGAASKARDFVLIELDAGFGMVQVLDGRLCRGSHGLAGELGFTVWDTADRSAEERRPRILEDLASLKALCGRAEQVGAVAAVAVEPSVSETIEEVWLRRLVLASRAGSLEARQSLDDAARAIGLAVANVINLLDPELILLTGRMASGADGYLLEPIRACVREHLVGARSRVPRIEPAGLGPDAALLGA